MSALLPNTRFDGGPNAVQRVALVVWWFAVSVAVICAGLAILTGWIVPKPDLFFGLVFGFFALCAWLIGRALFFILAAR